MENPPIFKNGKPSISMGHGLTGWFGTAMTPWRPDGSSEEQETMYCLPSINV